MNTIKIDLQYNLNQYQEEGEEPFYVLDTLVYIDGERVYKGFVEPYAFFKDVASRGVNTSMWVRDEERTRSYYYNTQDYSTFEPFSCSCGAAGCAGIWSGIHTKHRRKTVEWRTKEEDGYEFLKRFYVFDKQQYYEEIVGVFKKLQQLAEDGATLYHHGENVPIDEYYKNYWTYAEVFGKMKQLQKEIENEQNNQGQ